MACASLDACFDVHGACAGAAYPLNASGMGMAALTSADWRLPWPPAQTAASSCKAPRTAVMSSAPILGGALLGWR